MSKEYTKNKEGLLLELIDEYNSYKKASFINELENCRKALMSEDLSNIDKARQLLTCSHQNRMPNKAMVSKILGDACLWEYEYNDFEAVYDAVKDTISDLHQVGPLAIYDVALRIAYYRGIEPKRLVYLQCGALEGAKILLNDKKLRVGTIDATCFDKLLPGLAPMHIGHFLCIARKRLSGENKETTLKQIMGCSRRCFSIFLVGILCSLLAPLSAFGKIKINENDFPDENFRNWLFHKYANNFGVITNNVISRITSINVNGEHISSLEGIQYFTALKELYCSDNQLTSLDVSNNTALTKLYCNNNQLTSLDVSNNTALTTLYCNNNQLTSLDMSSCTALTYLNCHQTQLTNLDVSNCTALTSLDCSSNMLTNLDVSNCTALTSLDCGGNLLTSLDVSNCTELTSLNCAHNQIYEENMDKFIESLPIVSDRKIYIIYNSNSDKNACTKSQIARIKEKGWTPYYQDNDRVEYKGYEEHPNIEINENNFPDENFRKWLQRQNYGRDGIITGYEIGRITSIDVSEREINSLEGIQYFAALTSLYCKNNPLTSLDVSGCTALTELYCNNNKLTSLDATGCTALEKLECYENLLTSLDVSGCTALTELYCNNNKLTSLDATSCTTLEKLECYENLLTSLNVSGCTALTELYCNNNKLTSLDATGCTKLYKLYCYNNKLTNLNLSGCKGLNYLRCYNNQLKGANMDKFIASLPEYYGIHAPTKFTRNLYSYGQIFFLDIYSKTEGNDCSINQLKEIINLNWIAKCFTGEKWEEL